MRMEGKAGMKWVVIVGALLGLLAIADGIEARVPQRDWVMVRICQGAKTYALHRSADGTVRTRPLEDTIRLNLREGEVVRIEIVDPQPLLYSYRSGAIVDTVSELRSLARISRRFDGVGAGLQRFGSGATRGLGCAREASMGYPNYC